jgi:hypothetical protein
MREILIPGNRILSPDAVDNRLREKCGYLEEKHEKEFFGYISRQLSRTLTIKEQAEIGMRIQIDWLLHHTRGGFRRSSVESYKSVIAKHK